MTMKRINTSTINVLFTSVILLKIFGKNLYRRNKRKKIRDQLMKL